MHAKNADMYPLIRQNLPYSQTNGEPMLGVATPIDLQKPITDFKMVLNQNSRMGGSVPVWTPQIHTETASEIKNDNFGFADMIDMINPLQHIPFVGQIYRSITGDVIKPAMEIVGGALFGGPLGAATGAVSAAIGDDVQQTFASFVSSMDDDQNTTIAITNLRSPERYNN